MGTTTSTVGVDAPGRPAATDVELDLIRQTAAQVFDGGALQLRELGAMGWLGLLSAEERGGSGWLPVEATVVAREAGRAREASGWSSATLGAAAVAATDDDAVRARWADRALDGTEPVRWIRADVAEVRRVDHDDVRATVTATSPLLLAADAEAYVLVSDDGELLLVERDQPAVVLVEEANALDTRGPVHRVHLRDATAVRLPIGEPVGMELRAAALLLGAAAASGSLGVAVDRLVGYLSERVAFDAPIASFQAVQHRLVDLYVLHRRIEAVVASAARRLALGAPDALRLACIAHAFVAARIVPALDECIQLSGGIGFVWEYPLHHEMRCALSDADQFATARSSRALLATIEGW